jgi:hypothetical protein
MSWNKKSDQFALSLGLRPSTRLMLRWILRRAKLNEICEIEIDLRTFNAWVAKHRGRPYDRKTIGEALAQLNDLTGGMIVVLKSYTPWVHKLIVRPLAFVLAENAIKQGSDPKLATLNPMFDDDHKERVTQQQQQDISKIDSLLQQVGLIYDQSALNRIWRLAGSRVDAVVDAIELMLYRHSSKPIPRPHGFIVQCLKEQWQKGFDLYYEPELPKFNSNAEITEFIKGLCGGQRTPISN